MKTFKQFVTETVNTYSGKFNWHGETISLNTSAKTIKKAQSNMFHQLSKVIGVRVQLITMHFNGNPNSFEIKEGFFESKAVNDTAGTNVGYKKNLNSDEIVDYIIEQSPHWIDREMLEDLFRGATASLKKLSISKIKIGYENANISDMKKEKQYEKMGVTRIPPIIVENNEIKDGHHRFRIAKKFNMKFIWGYIVK